MPQRSTSAPRRTLLRAGAAGAALLAIPSLRAQGAFPNQPVKVVVPFGPGGFADITVRLLAQKMVDRLGQQVVIENKPGAGGIVAAQAALAAPADGHTTILFSNGTTIATTLLKLPYDPENDFAPVSSLAYFDLLVLTGGNSPHKDLQGLVAEGRRRMVNIGTINPGSTQHLSGELFKTVSGIQATVVPFKTSGEVQAALQRGDVDIGMESYAALKGAIDGGALRALACTGSSRTAWLPNVPTVREGGVQNYDVTGWNALYVPKGTPAAAVNRLNAAMHEALQDADLRKRYLDMGADPKGSTPAGMSQVFARDKAKWAQVIKQANIKVT